MTGSTLRHHRQHIFAVSLDLLHAQPRYLTQFSERRGFARGDLAQRGVVQDHIRGQALFVGGFAAPGAQGNEERVFVVVVNCQAGLAAFWARFDYAQPDLSSPRSTGRAAAVSFSAP